LNEHWFRSLAEARAIVAAWRMDYNQAANKRRGIAMMTLPWPQIVARYDEYTGEAQSIRASARLARLISGSQLAKGLFAWTSMFDLCIVQTPVSYLYDGPLLRISPTEEDRLEFRYLDTPEKAKQWHRTVEADQAITRLIRFLDQLNGFRPMCLNH
jgi:predicted protein tyrosine phosphatase